MYHMQKKKNGESETVALYVHFTDATKLLMHNLGIHEIFETTVLLPMI